VTASAVRRHGTGRLSGGITQTGRPAAATVSRWAVRSALPVLTCFISARRWVVPCGAGGVTPARSGVRPARSMRRGEGRGSATSPSAAHPVTARACHRGGVPAGARGRCCSARSRRRLSSRLRRRPGTSSRSRPGRPNPACQTRLTRLEPTRLKTRLTPAPQARLKKKPYRAQPRLGHLQTQARLTPKTRPAPPNQTRPRHPPEP
jgi:hypothetical protein